MKATQSFNFLRLFFSFSLIFIALNAQSQDSPKHFIEAGISPSSYRGDLNNSFQQWTALYNAGIKFYKKKRINGGINIFVGNIMGQNGKYEFNPDLNPSPTPNTYFKTNVIGVNYDLQLNLIKRKWGCIFISQGIGLMRFTPKDQNNDKLQTKLSTRAKGEDYNNVTFVFPTKAGVMFFLPSWYAIGLQAGYLNPTSDYLDNISNWGIKKKKDNILTVKFSVFIPLNTNKTVTSPDTSK
ncbi:hypothetical protein CHU_1620 [Sporocytophaga myxococcoides]|uniref:Outer membrane protein beta-barrel domain-containing protein n=1 Tax=Sporocytophaga myxococcoides TaxID=153721 RepID=A0A098LDF2_9BACT|nr:hypothetical protein [Sporocytophaga myxococcoides]GAL84976.1 hypothetical protein CHU_1620 [Sporocytophaga myxococcoides]